jgi:hypothetical protein
MVFPNELIKKDGSIKNKLVISTFIHVGFPCRSFAMQKIPGIVFSHNNFSQN